MSYGIVRVQKFTTGAVKGIEIHDTRKKEGVSHTNKDIDFTKSYLNYDLHDKHNLNFSAAVKDRINSLELSRAVRKDAIVMGQVLVTSDRHFFKGLSEDDQKQFFLDSYNFLCEKYGSENVISAIVHNDETTPHMHFNFVPVTKDGRLSAKSVFTRKVLQDQQTEFYEQVGKKYGLERGVPGGKKKHLDVIDYKIKTANEELERVQEKVLALRPDPQLEQITGKKAFLSDKVVLQRDDFERLKEFAVVSSAMSERAEEAETEQERLENLVLRLKESSENTMSLKIDNASLKAVSERLKAERDTFAKVLDFIYELPGFKQAHHKELERKFPNVNFPWKEQTNHRTK